jgi:lipopolysaccharide export system protein LptA
MGEQEVSTGDSLDAALLPATTKSKNHPTSIMISSVLQTGHVAIRSRSADRLVAGGKLESGTPSIATAERAEYDGSTGRLTLTGSPRLADETASVTAGVVVLNQQTGDAEAHGAVQTAMVRAATPGSGEAVAGMRSVTHVLSSNARFTHETKQMEFKGTDADPAKMWQDASQVDAATLSLDGVRKTFSARPAGVGGMVHAVFADVSTDVKAGKTPRSEGGRIIRVAAPKMDYNDAEREATFTGGARLDGTVGEVQAQEVVVFLSPAKSAPVKSVAGDAAAPTSLFGGSLDRAVAYGHVQMEQPGRHGVGDQLTYTASTDSFVLTGIPGHPPRIVDTQQGNVTGATLLFGQSGSTIVVAGEAVSGKAAHGRVRTETEVRP